MESYEAGPGERHPDFPPSSVSPSSAAATTTAGPAPAKRRRNNTTIPVESCLTCRARKVKCSGKSAITPCTNCARLDLQCSFVSNELVTPGGKVSRTTPSRSHTEAGTVRKRAQRACQQCHAHKTKCSADLPICKRCAGAGLNCEYTPAKRKFAAVPHQSIKAEHDAENDNESAGSQAVSDFPRSSTADPSTSRASSLESSDVERLISEKSLLNQHIILKHLHIWFDVLHPLQCLGFFHPQTTFKEAEEGRFTSILAAGICSMAGLFTSPVDEGRRFTERCNEWVKFHLMRTAGIFSKDRLAMLVLSCSYDILVGDWPRSWEYSATASRMVTSMQYNWDGTSGSFIEQECIRRLVWQVYILDRFLAGGFEEHLTLRDDYMYLSLPCDEYSFRANLAVATERLNPHPYQNTLKQSGNISLAAVFVRLMAVRHQILTATKKYATAPTRHPRAPHTEPSSVMGDVQRLQAQLNLVKESLPDNLQVSETNIERVWGAPEWPAYFVVHAWIFQLHIDLYRFSLPGLREQANNELLRLLPPDFLAKSQCQAIAFAITCARFLETCQNLKARDVQNPVAVLCADAVLPTIIVQSTKSLLIARQYMMFFDVREHSTVPPFRSEPVDDAVLAGLIESNVAILDTLEMFIPLKTSKDLRQSILNFQTNPGIDTPGMIGWPFVHPPDNVRLPGPHYALENLHISQTVDDEANRQRSASLADQYLRKRSGGSSRSSQLSASPPVPSNKQLNYAFGPPDMPFILAQARAGSRIPASPAPDATSAPHEQPQPHPDAFLANYQFDMSGLTSHIPSWPLLSPVTDMTAPGTPYDMTHPTYPQSLHPDVLSPQEQFALAQQQQQLGMYMVPYSEVPPQEPPDGQQYTMPYRALR